MREPFSIRSRFRKIGGHPEAADACDPTFFVSPDDFFGGTITGTFGVETTSDDDYIGFVLGYQTPVADDGENQSDWEFFLFAWKQFIQGAQARRSASPSCADEPRALTTSVDEPRALTTSVDDRASAAPSSPEGGAAALRASV